MGEELDIMGNIKLIETYKTFLLTSVSDLHVSMLKGSRANLDEIKDELSQIIILSYLLAKKLGIDYSSIDDKIIKKLRVSLSEDENQENADYLSLITYLKEGRE
ncbi:MazG-like family protein [Caloramator fervidus]|uniref:MazG-like family protein n=1 Tax=Caloramator fervidus TaxID=29344 RepID=A0A1H5WHQ3_9CLOT|nr:MazG-like family protein [Caloramator fervidus]SEF98781.1 MazG-like family protein [Caloramator fervidus]